MERLLSTVYMWRLSILDQITLKFKTLNIGIHSLYV